MSPFNSKVIANAILKKLLKNKLDANPIKLQKLIYFAHGWHLAITGTSLIDENIQGSSLGVVVSSIYHSCKEYGSNTITSALTDYNSKTSRWEEPHETLDSTTDTILNKVIEQYGKLTAAQLSNITHEKSTPWEQVVKNEPPLSNNMWLIEDEIIKTYFQEYANAVKSEGKKNLLNINIEDIDFRKNDLKDEADEITAQEHTEYVQSAYWTSFKGGDKKWKKIKEYALLWSPAKHKGIIKLTLLDNVEYKIVVKSFKEMDVIANIFRFERTVYYNLTSGALASGWSSIGKEK